MSEFKFSCPKCHQNIKVGDEFVNHQIECPVCQASLIVPPSAQDDATVPAATLGTPPPPVPAPNEAKPATATPAASRPEAGTGTPETIPPSVTTVAPLNDTRVAVMTPAIKLAIIRDMRGHLKDKSHWLPGKKEGGQYNYAARKEGDKLVPVSPTDASATHHSLFGAAMLAFHRLNVTRVTGGRQKFLDDELTAAIHQTLGHAQDGKPVSEAERESLTHEQCLDVLDVLEKRQHQDAKTAQKKNEDQNIDYIRLSDLLQKMGARTPVRVEEVICGLYYELEELKKRIAELEQNQGNQT